MSGGRLGVAFAAGLLSPVNPCGIAMLPAFLGFYLGKDDEVDQDWLARLWGGFLVGGAVSLGFVGVYVAAGLLASAGLRWILRAAPWTAMVLGVGLLGLGLAALLGRHIGVSLGQPLSPGQDRHGRSMIAFGAAYALASISCTLALLLAIVSQALATSSVVGLIGVFAAYGLGAATLITGLTVSAGLATGAAGRLRRGLPAVQRFAGGLLVIAGVYLIAYWMPVAMGGSPRRSVAALSEDLSDRLVAFLDGQWRTFVLVAVALAIGGVVVGLVRRRRRPSGDPAPEGAPNRRGMGARR